MGVDFYEVMKKAPEVVERWKKYYPLAQQVWSNARSRESLAAALITGPDPNPEELERWLAFIRALPYFLRGALQGIAKTLPPPPGGRPRELGRGAAECTETHGAALRCEPSNHTTSLAAKNQVEGYLYLKRPCD